MNRKLEEILYDALRPEDEPAPASDCQICEAWSKEDQEMGIYRFGKKIAAAGVACLLAATAGVTGYAAYRYLSPAQIAEEVYDNGALSRAFESEDAIAVNETQTSNGYDITLLGLVSGKELGASIPEGQKEEWQKLQDALQYPETQTYAAFSIAMHDGTDMQYRNFHIAPLINGYSVAEMNAASLSAGTTWFLQDGVIYELMECDNLEIFADKGVWLGIVKDFGDVTQAFRMEPESGIYGMNEEYEDTAALFSIPFGRIVEHTEEAVEARREAVERYVEAQAERIEEGEKLIESFRDGDLEVVGWVWPNGEKIMGTHRSVGEQIREFMKTLTLENIDQYLEADEDFTFTGVPDEKGWVDFGERYLEDYGIIEGGGFREDSMQEVFADGNFRVEGPSMSGKEWDKVELDSHSIQIHVLIKNDDGSYTKKTYRPKDNITPVVFPGAVPAEE